MYFHPAVPGVLAQVKNTCVSVKPALIMAALLALLITVALPIPSHAAGSLDEIIDKTQAAFDKTKSMKSDFAQVFESKGFGKTAEYRGAVFILKPSRMLWRYTEPKGRMLVSDGADLWLYDPEDNVAYHDQIKGFLHEKSPALFLAGEKTLRDLFTIDLVEPVKMDKLEKVVKLKLTPKSPQPGVKGMLLTADAATYAIIELMMVDHLGNRNKITFLNAERGVEIDPSIFKFVPPQGTPVRPMQKLPPAGQ
ncbi:MAG: outer membrane lipoprotein carrier protein LolA [Nitrospinae bacterium]|nr:outer membrane lipoprotein carrier protein LolA [Nitrospinota bacterium]